MCFLEKAQWLFCQRPPMGLPGVRIDCSSTGICGCKIITATIQLRLCNPALTLGSVLFVCFFFVWGGGVACERFDQYIWSSCRETRSENQLKGLITWRYLKIQNLTCYRWFTWFICTNNHHDSFMVFISKITVISYHTLYIRVFHASSWGLVCLYSNTF